MYVARLPSLADLFNLFFPNNCSSCNHRLSDGEEVVCLHCQEQLPTTDFHLHEPNPMSQLFWGRIDIQYALAAYYFFKKSSLQRLMHQFKYHCKTEIGVYFGQQYGRKLKAQLFDQKFDLIVPVPLHRKKKKIRGYNQSDYFAEGLSKSTKIEWRSDVLERSIYNVSQTKKSKYSRWENVERIFKVQRPREVKGKHILLVDDVVTTGSTLEACALQLHRAGADKVSLAVIGFAHH